MPSLSLRSLFMIGWLAATPAWLAQAQTPSASWSPVAGGMMTEWGRQLSPDKVWTEYPRPQLVRSNWINLNGLWSYAVTSNQAASSIPQQWHGSILVPFCPESGLSGVGRWIEPEETLWYRRSLPPAVPGRRSILHFEAVDYETTIYVNGTEVGRHVGGHTPFSFDITDRLQAGQNELVVRVYDATEGYQLHGKQNLIAKGIWYTRVTGIWQTVWMEQLPEQHLTDVDYACDLATGRLTIVPKLAGEALAKVRATASFRGTPVGQAEGSGGLSLLIADPQLWSPATPHLYEVQLEVLDAAGNIVDSVQAYTAFREFGKVKDAAGHWRLTLNGQPLFQWGPLDQGWWPDGLLTPPSDQAMLDDIEFLKAAGFNMIRKHIKVEPRRYYYHCDRLGMLVWQDQVSNGVGQRRTAQDSSPPWTRLKADPVDADWPEAAHQQWVLEYQRMVAHLQDTVSIACWVPFNEAWGQHRTLEVGKMAVALDPTRPVNIASGGNFWPVGDIADEHRYPDPGFPLEDARFANFVKVVGEFGGHGWPVPGHLWKESDKNWGYGKLPESFEEWKRRYTQSLRLLNELRQQGIAAGIYTQTTDVEVEVNGLRTYDRINKIDPAWLKAQAAILFE